VNKSLIEGKLATSLTRLMILGVSKFAVYVALLHE
jgi:hypothetical protein